MYCNIIRLDTQTPSQFPNDGTVIDSIVTHDMVPDVPHCNANGDADAGDEEPSPETLLIQTYFQEHQELGQL